MPVFSFIKLEKVSWKIEFTFFGESGHGSELMMDTAGEKLSYVIGKLMELQKIELTKYHELNYPTENVTSINLTILKGGIQRNVIPSEMSATFDIRLSIHADPVAFERQARN